MKLSVNCCDGIHDSVDIHFTNACDNRCKHCIADKCTDVGDAVPDVDAITRTLFSYAAWCHGGLNDVLFLGGEPCLFLQPLVDCVTRIKQVLPATKVYVTTAVPFNCCKDYSNFTALIKRVDGINLSVQHHDEKVADCIRRTKSRYDRQSFYSSLPMKEKIRINLNLVKPFLSNRVDIEACLRHYDAMGFGSIRLAELQDAPDEYVSFTDVFGLKLPSPYANGCQTTLDTSKILPGVKTPITLKRSCFLCEKSLKASLSDGAKAVLKLFQPRPTNNYAVIYGNGVFSKGWL